MDHLENKSIFNFGVTEETKTNLNGLSQWLNISAIIGLIGIGLSILSAIIAAVKVSKYSSGVAGGSLIFTFIAVVISLLLNITLLNAAKYIKMGVADTDQGFFSLGINRLATYLKIMGILIIVGLVIMGLAFFAVIISAGMR